MSIQVVDFFSGCGGTSAGLEAAGMRIALGLDNDPDAELTFRYNFPKAGFIRQDIRSVTFDQIKKHITPRQSGLLFCGCVPCQPWTKQNTTSLKGDKRKPLLIVFGRFVKEFKPEYVLVENVPGIWQGSTSSGPLYYFLRLLDKLGYQFDCQAVCSNAFGVPQRRRRLVLVASLHGAISLPSPTHGPGTNKPDYETVRSHIADLPPIDAGESHPLIPNHRAAGLSPLNLRRIRATPEGGTRLSWPGELKLTCHSGDYKGHSDVYGRMYWDRPASGLTTKCVSLSNGRFGHPVQHRAISVREAARLQTFPDTFVFHGCLASAARQVGNAVPVALARCIGNVFVDHYKRTINCGVSNGNV